MRVNHGEKNKYEQILYILKNSLIPLEQKILMLFSSRMNMKNNSNDKKGEGKTKESSEGKDKDEAKDYQDLIELKRKL